MRMQNPQHRYTFNALVFPQKTAGARGWDGSCTGTLVSPERGECAPTHHDSCHACIATDEQPGVPGVPGDIKHIEQSDPGVSLAVVTAGTCCWDKATGSNYPAILVRVGDGTFGADVVKADNAVVPEDFAISIETVSEDNTVKRKSLNMCIIALHRAVLLSPARIGSLFSLWTTLRLLEAIK